MISTANLHRFFGLGWAFLLSACVTSHPVDVPPTYQLGATLPGTVQEGVVAFSLQLNIDELSCAGFSIVGRCRLALYVFRTDAPKGSGGEGLAELNPFQVDATESGLYGPATYIAGPLQPRKDMVIWKLPEGEYAIYNWYLSVGNGTLSPVNFPEIYEFTVAGGKATYLGRLDLVVDMQERNEITFTSTVSDLGDTERAKLLETFPQFRDVMITKLLRKTPLS